MKWTKSQRAVLAETFLFRGLDRAQLDAVLAGRAPEVFARGQEIYSPHRFRRALGVLAEGEAVVEKDSGAVLNLLRPGDCFGAAALFCPTETYVTTIRARGRAAVLFLTDEELTAAFRAYPDMALAYIGFLSGRIQFLNRKIDSFTSPTAADAVWNWLVTHADEEGVAVAAGGLSALARELNIGRASLYRGLDQLEKEGRIVRTGATIRL